MGTSLTMTESEKNQNTGGLVRAQSSLELLSQTAALKNVLEDKASSKEQQQAAISSIIQQEAAPPLENKQQPAEVLAEAPKIASVAVAQQQQQFSPYAGRITPAENSTACSALSLPEMAGGPVFLEQKRSFLPAPFVEGGTSGDLENSPTYSPGLFLSYSNVSSSGTTASASNGSGINRTASNAESTTTAGPPPTNSGSDGGDNMLLGTASFSSAGNGSTASSFIPALNLNGIGSSAPGNMPTAFVPPRPQLFQVQRVSSGQLADEQGGRESTETKQQQLNAEIMAADNAFLRQQLAAKDATIEALQRQLETLQEEVGQLRKLPTGKISQIPIEEMISLMRVYGSEVSETSMPPRKTYVQKASVVRQFRRWNPNFLEHFEFKGGSWHPKLGKDGELRRRREARRLNTAKRNKKRHG